MIKRIALGTAGLFFIAAVGLELSAATAYANKVDCAKVMAEVSAGKKAKEIAKDQNISKSSVYSCKSKAKAAATKASPAASPVAAASPTSH